MIGVLPDILISTLPAGGAAKNKAERSGKPERVLGDLKVATLKIPDELRKLLIEVVSENPHHQNRKGTTISAQAEANFFR